MNEITMLNSHLSNILKDNFLNFELSWAGMLWQYDCRPGSVIISIIWVCIHLTREG